MQRSPDSCAQGVPLVRQDVPSGLDVAVVVHDEDVDASEVVLHDHVSEAFNVPRDQLDPEVLVHPVGGLVLAGESCGVLLVVAWVVVVVLAEEAHHLVHLLDHHPPHVKEVVDVECWRKLT